METLSSTVFQWGKYNGRTIDQVAAENMSYLEWAAGRELAVRAYLKKIRTGE